MSLRLKWAWPSCITSVPDLWITFLAECAQLHRRTLQNLVESLPRRVVAAKAGPIPYHGFRMWCSTMSYCGGFPPALVQVNNNIILRAGMESQPLLWLLNKTRATSVEDTPLSRQLCCHGNKNLMRRAEPAHVYSKAKRCGWLLRHNTLNHKTHMTVSYNYAKVQMIGIKQFVKVGFI